MASSDYSLLPNCQKVGESSWRRVLGERKGQRHTMEETPEKPVGLKRNIKHFKQEPFPLSFFLEIPSTNPSKSVQTEKGLLVLGKQTDEAPLSLQLLPIRTETKKSFHSLSSFGGKRWILTKDDRDLPRLRNEFIPCVLGLHLPLPNLQFHLGFKLSKFLFTFLLLLEICHTSGGTSGKTSKWRSQRGRKVEKVGKEGRQLSPATKGEIVALQEETSSEWAGQGREWNDDWPGNYKVQKV